MNPYDTVLEVEGLLNQPGTVVTWNDLPGLRSEKAGKSDNDPNNYRLEGYVRQLLPGDNALQVMSFALASQGKTTQDYLQGRVMIKPDYQDPTYRVPLHPEIKACIIPAGHIVRKLALADFAVRAEPMEHNGVTVPVPKYVHRA